MAKRVRWTRVALQAWLALFAISLSLSAIAKQAHIEWEADEGAIYYEIEILSGAKPVAREKLKASTWSGELDPGAYRYRVRAIDRFKRPGEWSSLEPLVIMPPPPNPKAPESGTRVRALGQKQEVGFSWKGGSPADGAGAYRLRIKQGSTFVFDEVVTGTSRKVALPSGNYTWSVANVVANSRRESADEPSHWEGSPARDVDFLVDKPGLDQPQDLSPSGQTSMPESRKVRFEWKPVEGAQKYLVKVWKKSKAAGRGPAGDAGLVQSIVTESSSTELAVSDRGSYEWEVQALKDSPEPMSSKAESARFELSDSAHGLEPLAFRVSETFLTHSGGSSLSPDFSWTPSWSARNGFGARAQIGYHSARIRNQDFSSLSILHASIWATYSPSLLRRITFEAGVGIQRWRSSRSFTSLGAGLEWRPMLTRLRPLQGIFMNVSKVDYPTGSMQQFSLGLSFSFWGPR